MVKENDSGKNIEIIKGDYNCVNPNQESLSTVSKLSHASDLMIISFHSLTGSSNIQYSGLNLLIILTNVDLPLPDTPVSYTHLTLPTKA